MTKGKILIAEDNDLSRDNLSEFLSMEGYEVKAVNDGQEAMDVFTGDRYDIVITDLKMPRASGLDMLKFVKDIDSRNVVIVITGHSTVKSAVEAMKLGAFDYIVKPLREDLVKIVVERALSNERLREENTVLHDHLKEKYDFGRMIGYSDSIEKVFEMIKKVAASDSTVVIYGESGTGKELVARAMHFNSDRRAFPLVTVNCGAIPEELLESELFGHEKGAFTGAIRGRKGRFELAQGGTIFLDEIGDMSPSLQVKVLRVIQEKQFERVGGVNTIDADVRIITATHQDLEKAVAEKRFREDLFYRINVIPITLPPLRERAVDIPVLANHFITMFNRSKKKSVQGIAPEAMDCLMRYRWPGNIRELQNLMERLVVVKASEFIQVEDLPEKVRLGKGTANNTTDEIAMSAEGVCLNDMLARFEKDLLQKALKKSGGVKSNAARLLALNRTTFVEKLKRYHIITD
ncbi:MAG: sigma-54 dependent transcriptional regulator [Syntrophales bacterium]|nr:sigma-54 dependent transcriptional regulator [Syntrophales bacterium]